MSNVPSPSTDAPGQPSGCSGKSYIQSKATEDAVVCPSCGQSDQVVTWDLLEASCNPERAAQLASGELLVHTCSHCGALLPLDYPLFYVDRAHKAAAYYPAGQGEQGALKTLFTQAVQRFRGVELSSLRKQEFEMRVVPERHELAEKVCAWQADLDDRLLEVFKASLLRELQARNPERNLVDLQFTEKSGEGEDAKLTFVLFSSRTGADGQAEVVPADASIAMPFEAYRRLARSLEVRSQIDLHKSPVVDGAWAREVLAAVEGELA